MRKAGEGSIFQKPYRDRQGNLCRTKTWYFKYRTGSRVICESTGSENRAVAEEKLKQILLDLGSFSKQVRNEMQTAVAELRAVRESNQVTVGSTSELIAAVHLLNAGYDVFRSVSHCASCDLIAIRGNTILRIEVKTRGSVKGKAQKPSISDRSKFDHLAIVARGLGVVFDPELPCLTPEYGVSCGE